MRVQIIINQQIYGSVKMEISITFILSHKDVQ